jgi:DNA-directed RNA polymerase subunit F
MTRNAKLHNVPTELLPAAHLQRLGLPELKEAAEVLGKKAKENGHQRLGTVEAAAERIVELRKKVALASVGDVKKFDTVHSLAEALLMAKVHDGMGLPYEEIAAIITEVWPDAETTVRSVQSYASKHPRKDELPPRPSARA